MYLRNNAINNSHLALEVRHSEPGPDAVSAALGDVDGVGGLGGKKNAVGVNRSLPYPLVKQNTNDSMMSSRFFSASSSMHSISENSVYSAPPDVSEGGGGDASSSSVTWNGHVTTEASSNYDAGNVMAPLKMTSSVSSTALMSSARSGSDDDHRNANGVVSTGNDNNNGVRLRGGGGKQQQQSVTLRQQHRRHSISDISKRLSLPADLKIPDRLLIKESFSQLSLSEGPLSRRARRTSLTEIGFGKMESYVKLEKLGEGTYATVFKVSR